MIANKNRYFKVDITLIATYLIKKNVEWRRKHHMNVKRVKDVKNLNSKLF